MLTRRRSAAAPCSWFVRILGRCALRCVDVHELLPFHALQVTCDSVAVLHTRYQQYSELLASLGFQDGTLAACVQPANKVNQCLQ